MASNWITQAARISRLIATLIGKVDQAAKPRKPRKPKAPAPAAK